jgi:hypothetical protein
VVFADDAIGVYAAGEPARVDHDVVVTAIVPARLVDATRAAA